MPLARFQGVKADMAGTKKLLSSVNTSRSKPRDEPRFEALFKIHWPRFKEELGKVPDSGTRPPERSEREILEEILNSVRSQPSGADFSGLIAKMIVERARDTGKTINKLTYPGSVGGVLEAEALIAQMAADSDYLRGSSDSELSNYLERLGDQALANPTEEESGAIKEAARMVMNEMRRRNVNRG